MALLKVLVYPDELLRRETQPVTVFDDELKRLIADMRETMIATKGVGLAAPQVGVPMRLVVLEWEGARYALANPRVIEQEGEVIAQEGCLSFPGIYEDIPRPERLRVVYADEDGVEHDEVIEGFLARIFAHEIDHLEGRLLIDRLSPLKRAFLKKKMARRAKRVG